ncbi:MAG: arginine--tRNA ligase [Candidatus Aminicenantes bacterium]|nr:MAG: arginine--tRNA ligase [Candidatus Aminicenantes bacterium]
MIQYKAKLKEQIRRVLMDKYPLQEAQLEISYTPHAKMGDLALPFPLQLAKKIKKQPRELAAEIVPLLSDLCGVDRIEVAGPGFINLFLNRRDFFLLQVNSLHKPTFQPEEKKTIIEHTNINPNKAAHVGHLRNAVLGDTLGRCLKYKGENVEIQNYIDDTGIQVVDVTFGFMDMEHKTLKDIQMIEEKFDYYCWDLYTRVSSHLEEHPEAQSRKSEILRKIEEGEPPEAKIAEFISRRILKAHLETMKRIDVRYDVLPCESSILGRKFWDEAFSLLKEKGAVYFVDKGINKDCWVMKLDDDEEREKIIVRSDGTVTYVGKDIAYQLWKFGLLQKDFYYEPFTEENGRILWISTAEPKPETASFGDGSLVYNVIDTRQSYLQKIVVQGLRSLGFQDQADKSIHFSYEMVALSPKSLEELGQKISSEDKERNFLEVSGRKGLGVKADDLLDRLEQKAYLEVEKRNQDLPSEQRRLIARQIATGALRYFMLKFTRNSIIVFDFEEALSFEGETGPYLQYSLVRINSIFRKLKERENFTEKDLQTLGIDEDIPLDTLSEQEQEDFWELVIYASQFEEEIQHSVRSLEFSHIAKFAFNLCQKFNAYYHKYQVLAERDKSTKSIRIWTIQFVREVLSNVLCLMGIPQPMRM